MLEANSWHNTVTCGHVTHLWSLCKKQSRIRKSQSMSQKLCATWNLSDSRAPKAQAKEILKKDFNSEKSVTFGTPRTILSTVNNEFWRCVRWKYFVADESRGEWLVTVNRKSTHRQSHGVIPWSVKNTQCHIASADGASEEIFGQVLCMTIKKEISMAPKIIDNYQSRGFKNAWFWREFLNKSILTTKWGGGTYGPPLCFSPYFE